MTLLEPAKRIEDVECEKILVATRLLKHENVYSLEPAGHRGAISFQQHRAFQLIAALDSFYGEKLKNMRIAVIGGGVTGLTASAALYNLGCEEVIGYEAKTLMHKQIKSTERLVHPDYNRWPMLGGMNNFTKFQILNWYAGPANVVAKTIVESFGSIANRSGDTPLVFNLGMELKKANYSKNKVTSKKQLELTFVEDNNPKKISECFDLVILTTGFGIEEHDKDYWELQTEIKGLVGKDGNKSIKIFGTGDSGLIDLFNCFLNTTNTNTIWRMMLGYASIFRNDAWSVVEAGEIHATWGTFSKFEQRIRDHEISRRAVASSIIHPDIKTLTQEQFNAEMDVLNHFSEDEKQFYEGLVKDNKSNVEEFLEPFLVKAKNCTVKPQLIGLLKTPFQPTQAPLNKLLLAYLTLNERITYSQFTKKKSRSYISKCRKMTVEENRINTLICHIGESNKSRSSKRASSIEKIFDIGPVEKIIANLLNFSTSVSSVPAYHFRHLPGGKSEYSFIMENYETQVQKFFVSIGCTEAKAPAKTMSGVDKEPWVVEFSSGQEKNITELIKSMGGLEKEIAGFPIQWQVPKDAIGDI